MKIAIFSAATRSSRAGNWVTTSRWQKLLRSAGHPTSVLHHLEEIDGCDAEVLIGLHARRSSQALIRFKKLFPNRTSIVALTGTDLYRDLAPTKSRHPALAVRALDECRRIVLLQPLMAKRLKKRWQKKSRVVMMDVSSKSQPKRKSPTGKLKACVVGHMRFEKDSLRAAMAVRLPSGTIEVTHVGDALTESLQQRAKRESDQNANWNWRGSVSYAAVQALMKRSDLLVNSSRIEGAPNVLFEALSLRLPIIASKIDGHVGILGEDYGGYFKVGDTVGLRKLLLRCSQEPNFYRRLAETSDRIAKKYKPGNEVKALLDAILS